MAAKEPQIAEVERHFGVRFPDDYRQFVVTQGSMEQFLPPANSFVAIYPIDDIIKLSDAGDIQKRFPRAVVIGGNGSRELLAYDFRQAQPPLVLFDTTAADWSDAIYQAASLTELLTQLPERGWLFGQSGE